MFLEWSCIKSLFFLLQEELLINQGRSLILKEHVLQLIKHIHSDLLPISLAQLPILLHMSPLHILPLVFLAIGVELIPQEFQIGLLLLLQLHADPHLALVVTGVTQGL